MNSDVLQYQKRDLIKCFFFSFSFFQLLIYTKCICAEALDRFTCYNSAFSCWPRNKSLPSPNYHIWITIGVVEETLSFAMLMEKRVKKRNTINYIGVV
jgi:hypothetical protein